MEEATADDGATSAEVIAKKPQQADKSKATRCQPHKPRAVYLAQLFTLYLYVFIPGYFFSPAHS